MKIYGLLGKNIDYSFSRKYFSEKFQKENIPCVYKNFDLKNLDRFQEVLVNNPSLSGLNVTIPYKELIIPYLDGLDAIAGEIGAVNTIKIDGNKKLIGYNTDYYGFMESLKPYLLPHHTKALILGTGGASKAIAYALKTLKIAYTFVSRTAIKNNLNYNELTRQDFEQHNLLINCTPLGTHPNLEEFPPIPTEYITSKHLIYDLIYNPPVTKLMHIGIEKNATVLNGKRMLELQAEKSWEIWNSYN